MIITLDRDETIYLYDGEAMLIPAGNEVQIVFEYFDGICLYPTIQDTFLGMYYWAGSDEEYMRWKSIMRNKCYKLYTSQTAIILQDNRVYVGMLKSGLSILPDVYNENVDLKPSYFRGQTAYKTHLPIECVLKNTKFPVFIRESEISISDRVGTSMVWLQGIVPYSTNVQDILKYITSPPEISMYPSDIEFTFQ